MTDEQQQPRTAGDRRQIERRRFPREDFSGEERRVTNRRSGEERRAAD